MGNVMDKKALRKLIREEVQQELYAILPKLLKEVVGSILAKPKKRMTESASPIKKSFDAGRLKEMLGYGEMTPELHRSSKEMPTVAGIPVEGGLADYERKMGVSHLNDVPQITEAIMSGQEVEEYESVAVSAVPDSIVKALGSRAKQVLAEADRKKNWRPGMKK